MDLHLLSASFILLFSLFQPSISKSFTNMLFPSSHFPSILLRTPICPLTRYSTKADFLWSLVTSIILFPLDTLKSLSSWPFCIFQHFVFLYTLLPPDSLLPLSLFLCFHCKLIFFTWLLNVRTLPDSCPRSPYLFYSKLSPEPMTSIITHMIVTH